MDGGGRAPRPPGGALLDCPSSYPPTSLILAARVPRLELLGGVDAMWNPDGYKGNQCLSAAASNSSSTLTIPSVSCAQ